MENDNQNSEIVGLILAAGYSSRMGAFKPLLQIGNMTAVERIAENMKRAGFHRIVGVTGHNRDLLRPILESNDISEAFNHQFAKGMFTSVQRGIEYALSQSPKRPEGFFLMLADSPLVPPEVLTKIAEKHRNEPDAFIVPTYHGKKGHPLFIPACYTDEILSYSGEGGLKAITNRHDDRMIRLEVNEEAVVMDMDTPEGYQEILDYFEKQEDYSLDCQLKGRRIFFIRHGEIRQHREKIFLGQADIPLSEIGREQACDAAEEMVRYGIDAKRIYTSDLSRAVETAESIRKRLSRDRLGKKEIDLVKETRLREISLGEWDGRYVSEIMKNYPEEYKKRGEDLLAYKFGNDCENFYDLQYRALKGFRSILKQEEKSADESRDIVIVSHWGVINVILCRLHHAELKDEVKKPVPNCGIILMDFT